MYAIRENLSATSVTAEHFKRASEKMKESQKREHKFF
jgi:hypothetical protein